MHRFFLFSILLLSGCGNEIVFLPDPDFYTSKRRSVEQKRKLNFVEYKPGDVYTNRKTLYYCYVMGIRCVQSDQYGELLKVIPIGTKFTITGVKVSFSISGDRIKPYFDVEGIKHKNVHVIGFTETNYIPDTNTGWEYDRLHPYYKVPKGYLYGRFYNREYFEKCR